MFLVIQEYYRNYENNNKILLNYVHDKTPKNILMLLKISLTLLYFSNKPQYAIVNDAVQEGKNLKKERLDTLMQEGGISSCGNAQNCVEACPRSIPLTESIAHLGKDVSKQMWSNIFGG